MRRIMMTLAVATMGMTAMMAQSHEVTTTDKDGNKVVYEISDAAATKGDTLSITTFDPKSVAKSDSINNANKGEDYELTKEDIRSIMHEMDIDTGLSSALGFIILSISLCVILPIVFVLAVLLYRYYSRKKKYELAQRIVDSGQPLPDNFLNELKEEYREDAGLFEKGVKNVAIGITLTIFLWLMTGEAFLASIGLFVVANGASQLLSYYHHKGKIFKEDSIKNIDTNSND
ncbi:MAG: hypothetical protein IJ628_02975 [Bacteroidaceae bacterium]|nr:hypothetical protein [Bacteroidaceae bacterium]